MTATGGNLAGAETTEQRRYFESRRLPFVGRCPAHNDGKCHGDHAELPGDRCPTFICPQCSERRPWCFGGADDERCDACVTGIAVPS